MNEKEFLIKSRSCSNEQLHDSNKRSVEKSALNDLKVSFRTETIFQKSEKMKIDLFKAF